jgi:hypothetical protein
MGNFADMHTAVIFFKSLLDIIWLFDSLNYLTYLGVRENEINKSLGYLAKTANF